MKRLLQVLVLAAIACVGLPTAFAAQNTKSNGTPPHYVNIPFANLGNIRDWRYDTNTSLYVQSQNRQWYRITLWATCPELSGAARIAFVTDATGDLDKFSSILVRGDRCWFRTFEKSAPPEKKRNKK